MKSKTWSCFYQRRNHLLKTPRLIQGMLLSKSPLWLGNRRACNVLIIIYFLFCAFFDQICFSPSTLTLIQPYKDEHVSFYPNNTADVDNQEFSEQFKYADIKHTTSFLQDRRNSLKFIKVGAYSFPL